MGAKELFIPGEVDYAHYYQENGYVVCRDLIPDQKIDTLLDLYRTQIVPSESKFYRQNTNRYEASHLNPHGHVIQSFLDVHAYANFPEFQRAVLQVYFSVEMDRALREVTGVDQHNLMQSMLFDLNAATTAHQDWWYLDSVPAGGITAAWIALEDIEEAAGRFYVLPGSHRTHLEAPGMPHSQWLECMRVHVENHRSEIHAPALKKGDVLFWNSGTVHGALPTLDNRLSRKSLTAHYLPSEAMFGNLFTQKPWVKYTGWEGRRYFANQPEYSVSAEIVSRVKVAVYDNPTLLRMARKFQRKSITDLK